MLSLRRRLWLLVLVGVGSLVAATAAVVVLERAAGVPNASIVYLTAVVATAYVAGTPGAIVASVASFLVYDFLFTEPYYTFTISDPGEWLSVALLLFVGIVVGQLAALQRSRTEEARAREREARALFQVSRALATRDSTAGVLPTIGQILRAETHMERIWVALGTEGRELVAADTGTEDRPASPAAHWVLRRMPGEEPARWLRVHQPTQRRTAPRIGWGVEAYRVRVEAGGTVLGSIWALRSRSNDNPDRTETRLLAAAADQVGQALVQDRMSAEARAAEIARQSDELKSALLQSVSHDLRTPLATIRAAAGSLRPGSGLTLDEQVESADAIDREVAYLDRLVTNLLDLSRIEAGALRAERDVYELDDLVGRTIDRLRPRLAGRPIEVAPSAAFVEVDPVFLDEAVTNTIDNAIKYTAPDVRIRVRSAELDDEPYVRLTVEDAGVGVPAEHQPRLFEKFFRVPGRARGSRSGTGIGLAVVRGLVEAMGGRVAARRSELGGLAIDLDLPRATVPAELTSAGHR